MVGGDLRLRSITAPAKRALNLLPSDVGRPISDLNLSGLVPDLSRVVRDVIENVRPVEREVNDREGRWYLMRVHPYHTARSPDRWRRDRAARPRPDAARPDRAAGEDCAAEPAGAAHGAVPGRHHRARRGQPDPDLEPRRGGDVRLARRRREGPAARAGPADRRRVMAGSSTRSWTAPDSGKASCAR